MDILFDRAPRFVRLPHVNEVVCAGVVRGGRRGRRRGGGVPAARAGAGPPLRARAARGRRAPSAGSPRGARLRPRRRQLSRRRSGVRPEVCRLYGAAMWMCRDGKGACPCRAECSKVARAWKM